jgi:hypothetical protein
MKRKVVGVGVLVTSAVFIGTFLVGTLGLHYDALRAVVASLIVALLGGLGAERMYLRSVRRVSRPPGAPTP